MSKPLSEALGIVEVKGLIAAVSTTDAMAKAANVRILDKVAIGNAFVATSSAATSFGPRRRDAGAPPTQHGELISAHVIPRPEEAVLAIFLGSKRPYREDSDEVWSRTSKHQLQVRLFDMPDPNG